MQTVAVTQSKNIQYSSVGYSVTFIPFDAFFSFWKGAEGVQVCGLLPCCPSFYSHWKRDEGSAAHQCACTHPLAFISNFSSLGKFLSESGAPDYIAHPAPLTTAGCEMGNWENSTTIFFVCKISSDEFFFPYSAEEQLNQMTPRTHENW